ncbi:MAG: class I SAM-dependent methyltransferase [Blastocatellia bacterium]
MTTTTLSVTDMSSIKARMKATWVSGDFDKIGQVMAPGAVDFIERLRITPYERMLDVACGSGNVAFPAARAGAIVTGVDIAPNLLATARARAVAENLRMRFDEGDAESLPYADAAFDTVVTMFGAMFAPQPELAAAELLRVRRPGGRIAMANWTPDGFIGRMFKTTAAHVAPPNIPSPLLWGDETIVRQRLGGAGIQTSRHMCSFRLPMTPAQTVDYFRAWYGPTLRAFAALDENGQAALHRDLTCLWTEYNQATDGTTHVDSEYLEVILKGEK